MSLVSTRLAMLLDGRHTQMRHAPASKYLRNDACQLELDHTQEAVTTLLRAGDLAIHTKNATFFFATFCNGNLAIS